jgi:hypothetical protein
VAKIAARASVLRRDVRAQQSCLSGFAPDVLADMLLLTPLLLVRHHFGFNEARDGIPKNRQVAVHPGRHIRRVHATGFSGTGSTGASGVVERRDCLASCRAFLAASFCFFA